MISDESTAISHHRNTKMEAITAIKPLIRVAALSGSLRKGSFNTGLLRTAIDLSKESVPGMQIEYIDISPLPLIKTDLEINGTYPPVIEAFRQKILEADSILFASPEYNYSVSGLEYLHNGCRPSMVHRDINCTNILLDEHFTAKIADFGHSRSFQLKEESHVWTVVAGTPGYLDPEYYRTGRLAEVSDVYSFGIVLLEIMTNQRVIDQTRQKSHITEWTASVLSRGDITKIMDPNLNGDYNSRSDWRALELAMMCANPSSENRPSMSQVVVELKECLISENKMKSNNQDIDSQSSLELSMSFDSKTAPSAR